MPKKRPINIVGAGVNQRRLSACLEESIIQFALFLFRSLFTIMTKSSDYRMAAVVMYDIYGLDAVTVASLLSCSYRSVERWSGNDSALFSHATYAVYVPYL